MSGSEEVGVHSTKRPLQTSKGNSQSKRQKRELQEDVLLQKAVACMERATGGTQSGKDSDDTFGEYVAAELRSVPNEEMKRVLKFRIQSLLFSALSGTCNLYPPPGSQQFTQPHNMYGNWEFCGRPSTNSSRSSTPSISDGAQFLQPHNPPANWEFSHSHPSTSTPRSTTPSINEECPYDFHEMSDS